MDPICGMGEKIRDLVLDQIWKQLLYLVHFHRNIEQLYGRLDNLIRERSSIQHRIDEATNNTDKIDENVLHWLRKVDEISEQVHKLHKKSEAKLEGGIMSCPNPWLRCKLSKRAETIAQEAVKIYGEGNFVTVSYRVPSQSMPELTNRESNEGIDSRVEIKNHIMEALRNPRFNRIGLCGLGGVGKTTIAKDIEKEEKNQKVFEKVIMATVSQEMKIGNIQDRIIDELGMQLIERTEEGKASRLYMRLEKEKNMLLILDDLWQELDLAKVGIPFANMQLNEGCKILLTSRNETLLSNSMKCQKVIKVGVLSEDEAWELFQSIAKLSFESSSPDLKSIATEIVQKCRGLPLAIATAAKALKDKNIDGWRDYLERLKHPLARSFTGIKEVDTILKLSYDPLSRENKDIFLLSAMLSHDPTIEDLLMYSVGLDILKHPQNMGDARNAICDIVGKLKSLNLFLNSFSSHHFTMHDVFRDVAVSIASEELNAVIVRHRRLNEWPDEIDPERCKGICLQESDICDLPEELHGPILEFFFLNNKKSDLTIPNMFFKSSEKLKVLAITNVHFSSLPLLIFLRRLKALCLHSCLLEDIAEIRSLRTLKVLSLAYSEIERLPIELAELSSLQMLNLSHCSNLKEIPQKLLSNLKKLEVLYMANSFHQWKIEGSSEANENASLDELKDLPISSLDIQIPNVSMLPENLFLKMNLRRYRIFIGMSWEWEGNYGTSKILKLELESSIDLTVRLRNLSKGVEDLHLYGSNGQENVLYNLGVSGFPCLRHLHIESNDDIKYVVLNSEHHEDAFPILESLELKNLKGLKNLCEGPNDIIFGQLHTLKMNNLRALIGDFSIMDRTTKNGSNKFFKSLFNKKVLFPKLEILELYNLSPSIDLIWDDQLSNNSFSNLKRLMVEGCGFVKLMPVHVLKYLNNLEELEVSSCYKLENMFHFEYLNYNEEMASSAVIVPLKKLKLQNLPKMKNVCSNNSQGNWYADPADLCIKDGVSNNASREISKSFFNKVLFPNLEILELSNLSCSIELIWGDQLSQNPFSNLKILRVKICDFVKLVPFHVLKSLNNLEELEVERCNMLEIVFDFEDLNDYKEMESSSVVVPLKKLKLSNLPKLKNVWSNHHQGIVSFRCLRSVDVSFCESLTSIFPAFIAKGMLCDLEELRIDYCGIDVIVAKDQVLESAAVTFEFPSLTSLDLSFLRKLRSFFPHQHTLKLPHLHRLSITFCDELEIFEKEVSSSSEIHEEESTLDSKYSLFSHHDEVIQELEKLTLWGKEADMMGSGQFPMYHFPNVKLLSLYAKKATTISYRSLLKSFTRLEALHLSGKFKKAFGGEDVAHFPKLTLSFDSIMTSLSPSLVSSPNLTHLNVIFCDYWTTLMTSSIARSLVHLTHLSVDSCHKMEEIVTMQEEEDDENKEIIFIKLKFLKLINLPELRRFCRRNYTFRFPLLDKLVIKKCLKFKRFSPGLIDTPSLRSVQHSERGGEHHEIWDTNLNKTFYQQRYVISRELVLDEDDAIMIRNDQFPADCYLQVEILVIEGFVEEWVTFRYTLLERFPKLNALHVKNCSFEEIFPSHIPSSTSFHNLTLLKVAKCDQLVYLVVCSTVKSLVSLETLEIDDCEKLEEIVRNETSEDVEQGITFNGLRILKLTHLPRLKMQEDKKDFNIEDRVANTRCKNISRSLLSYNKHLHSSFSNLKTLIVEDCDLMKLVPLHVLKSLNNLEKLEVSYCDKLEMLFGYEDLNDYKKEMESSSGVMPLSLAHVKVCRCHGLTTLMTSSVASSLVHITHLSISYCDQIEDIIRKQEGEDDEDMEIIFNQMKFLELDHLPRLKRFCGYNYAFRFSLLEHVTITECPQLTMFCLGVIHAPWLQSVQVSEYEAHNDIWMMDLNNTIQHLFTFEEVISTTFNMALNGKNMKTVMGVFPNVGTLYVESFTEEGVTFPYSSLERFPKLYKLYVEHCSFEEIFPSQDEIIDFMGKLSPFRELYIAYMDKLKRIWKDDSQLPPIHQNLKVLKVKNCCSLAKLAPSSASFQNLWSLSVFRCHQLTHLLTTSTAKSLVSLWSLDINDCKKMEEIVKNDTNEDVESGITFNRLWAIKLIDMPSLKMFSAQCDTLKFPKLEKIEITGCPKMKMFCQGVLETPNLSKVKIEEHDMDCKDGGDLNKTIEMLPPAKDSVNI